MLNNITNFFNLIQTGMVKSQLESADLLPIGTRDSRYGGNYKPTMIKYSDLAAQILSGVPPLTIGTTPIASGTVGKLLYEGVGNVLNESPVFNIDPLTGYLGAGTTTPQFAIDMQYNSLGFYSGPTYYASLGLNNGSFYLTSYSDFVFGTSVVGNPLTIKQNGNVLINTGTDAGYKLDVNGTARVNNDLTIGSNRYLKAFRWTNDDVTRALQLEGNSNYNVDAVNIISLNNALLNNTKNLVNIGLASTVSTQSSGSTDFFNSVLIQTAYNFTGGTHTVRGIYYNPTLTSLTGTTHRAIETTSGDVIINTQTATATVGYTTLAVGGSTGAYFKMYIGTNPAAQNLRGQIWAVGNNLIFDNPSLGYLGLYTASYSGITILPTTGNVHVGTGATDAGFKLDVNGTARVVGSMLVQGMTVGLGGGAVAQSVAIGKEALQANTTYQNCAVGYRALYNTTGGDNTAVGAFYAMFANTTGGRNTGIGSFALNGNTTGQYNTAIGYNTSSGNFSNSTILGYGAAASADNQFVVGSSAVNAGAVTSEVNASTQVWNVIINGVARKILLA